MQNNLFQYSKKMQKKMAKLQSRQIAIFSQSD